MYGHDIGKPTDDILPLATSFVGEGGLGWAVALLGWRGGGSNGVLLEVVGEWESL